jgi:hypothetical protein
MTKEKLVTVRMMVEPDLRRRAKAKAVLESTTLADVLRAALLAFLQKGDKKTKD